MQRGVFKLRLEDGDDIIVVESCSVRPTTGNTVSGRRPMEASTSGGVNNNGDHSNSSDDDLSNETLSSVRAAAKHASAVVTTKGEPDEKKVKLARPPSAFCLFFRDYEKVLKSNRPNVTMAELQKLALQNWEAMEPSAKQRYIDENSRLKEEYDRSLAAIESNSGNRSVLPARTCRGFGCSKPAVENKLWDRDFCGSQCVVNFCREVFNSWVAEQKKNP